MDEKPPVADRSEETVAARRLTAVTADENLRRILRHHLRGALATDPESSLIACLRAATTSTALKNLLDAYREMREDERRCRLIARLLRRAPYAGDNLASLAAADWLEDERFKSAYEAGRILAYGHHDLRWRRYTLMTCAARAAALPGDFVECGVDRGGGAQCIISYLGNDEFAARSFYLFDTFSGSVAEQVTEEEARVPNRGITPAPRLAELVRATFADKDFVRIVEGPVPDSLVHYRGTAVAYLHIDMNVAFPECEALKYFWPHLQPGAPVVFDDYGFAKHSVQRRDLDKVAEELGVRILMLPTGQGLLWR